VKVVQDFIFLGGQFLFTCSNTCGRMYHLATMHSITDRQHNDDNSRSYCMKNHRLKFLTPTLKPLQHNFTTYWQTALNYCLQTSFSSFIDFLSYILTSESKIQTITRHTSHCKSYLHLLKFQG